MTCPQDSLGLRELLASCLLTLQLLGLDLVFQLLSGNVLENFIQNNDRKREDHHDDPVLYESAAYHCAQRSGAEQEVQVRDVENDTVKEH